MNYRSLMSLLGSLALAAPLAVAQQSSQPSEGRRMAAPSKGLGVRSAPEEPGISWFGTWDGALAEAKRTRRPILLMSAVPTCHHVPGVW